jgi:hypothetical protein
VFRSCILHFSKSILHVPNRLSIHTSTSVSYHPYHVDVTRPHAVADTSGATRCSTLLSLSIHAPSRVFSSPICPRDSTRGCTHVMCAFWSTWSNVPRINLRLEAGVIVTLIISKRNVPCQNLSAKEPNTPQRLHDQVFYFVQCKSGLLGDSLE